MSKVKMRDGQSLYVRQIGRGKPVILLHGFGMHSGHWLPFALAQAHRYRFIIPDLRGFGRSHPVAFNQACALTNYADDLRDLMEQLRIRQAKLVGISMGAFTALQYHRLYGFEGITHYMHIDQSPHVHNDANWRYGIFGEQSETKMDQLRQMLQQLDGLEQDISYRHLPREIKNTFWQQLGDFFAAALSRNSHKLIARQACKIEPLISRVMPTQHWHNYISVLRAYLEQDYDMRPGLKNIRIPVQVMVGMKSEMYPYLGQLYLAQQIPDARVVSFENSGHTLILDEPLKFARQLGQFAAA